MPPASTVLRHARPRWRWYRSWLDFRDAFLETCLTSGFHALASRRRWDRNASLRRDLAALSRCCFLRRFFRRFLCRFLRRQLLRGGFLLRSLPGFPVFFGARAAFFARFFGADALAPRLDLPACLRPFFLATFFLALATTNSFIAQTRLLGMTASGASSASLPQAARTPRKPAVFARDCNPRCRARRG